MRTATPKEREDVDRLRLKLPDEPGVYVYHDGEGSVLYVGKAKSLRKRVNSYFTKSHDAKTHALVMHIARVEIFALSSEREALVFESTLIKRYRPPFNVMLRDDKTYPFIAVTLGDEFPRVLFTRESHRSKVRYFGPYSSAKRVRQTLDLLNHIFPYRPCEGVQPGRQSGTPCLDYHIERCAAPCVGYISREDYRGVIEEVMQVLSGKSRPIEKRLEAQMQEASKNLEFEKAARIRNRLRNLEMVLELQSAERPGSGSFDVIGVALGESCANVQLLQVRDGRLADRSSNYLDNTDGHSVGTVLVQFALGWYGQGRPIPSVVVVPQGSLSDDDTALLQRELTEQRESNVEVRSAQRGDKRRLVDLAQRNAEHALTYDTLRARERSDRRAQGLEQLREELDLENLPLRIECYDISNLQDEAPVASMVVLEDGVPRKAHYRSFSIRYNGGQDDFAMMAEAIERRFSRLNNEAEEDESFSTRPDLVVIDGGKGQLGVAVEKLRELAIERVAICSLAKREEEVFLPGQSQSVILDVRSPGLHLLQRVRNEAHRFALGKHRARRSKDRHTSLLDSLEGVGDARRRALLNFFGSPERVLTATIEDLESVPGLPGKVARNIYDQLHRFGGDV